MRNSSLLLFATLAVYQPSSPAAAQEADAAQSRSADCADAAASLSADQARLFCSVVQPAEMPTQDTLASLDEALAVVPASSRFNAVLQTRRAEALVLTRQDESAERAYELAVAAYPDEAAIRISAVSFLSRAESHKDEAADFWLDLIGDDPAAARQVEPEVLARLVLGLPYQGERNTERALALADALDVIGYDARYAYVRDLVASLRFRERAADGDRDSALAALGQVRDPASLARFATDGAYRDYWPAIGWEDGGTRATAWRSYLETLAAEADGDPERIGSLMGYLQPFVPPEAFIAAYEHVLVLGLALEDQEQRGRYVAWVEPLANAYLAAGDPVNAERVHTLAAEAMSAQSGTLQMALAVRHAELLVELGRHSDAEAAVAAAIEGFGDALMSRMTLERLHAVRLRALAGRGDISDNDPSMAQMRQWLGYELIEAIDAFLMIGEDRQARDALRRRLRMNDFYPEALAYLQPSDAGTPTPSMAERDRLISELLADRQLREAIDRRGRVLPGHAVVLEDFPFPLPATVED